MKYHDLLTRQPKLKKNDNIGFWWGGGGTWECKMVHPTLEKLMQVYHKVKSYLKSMITKLSYNPHIASLGIYPRGRKTHVPVCMWMFRVALSITAPNWKQSKHPPSANNPYSGVVYPYAGTLPNHQMDQTANMCNDTEEPQKHYGKWRKSHTPRSQRLHTMILSLWDSRKK